MLFINKNERSVAKSKAEHLKAVRCRIRKKITGSPCDDRDCKVCKKQSQIIKDIPLRLEEILMDDFYFEMLIAGDPENLILIDEMIWKEILSTFDQEEYLQYLKIRNKKIADLTDDDLFILFKYQKHYKLLGRIFDYDGWFYNAKDEDRYDAYTLALNLDRRTCIYCNRIWTSTVKNKHNKKVMRPNYDHWYPQTRFPALALSFCNLIPSCTICNSSIKNDDVYSTDTHMHPYIDLDSNRRFRYSYDLYRSTNTIRIKIIGNADDPKAYRTYKDLMLEDLYSAHHPELKDMLDIKSAYSERYIARLIENFDIPHLSVEEIYKLAFGVEYNENNYFKKPLSKFKKDILTELKIID